MFVKLLCCTLSLQALLWHCKCAELSSQSFGPSVGFKVWLPTILRISRRHAANGTDHFFSTPTWICLQRGSRCPTAIGFQDSWRSLAQAGDDCPSPLSIDACTCIDACPSIDACPPPCDSGFGSPVEFQVFMLPQLSVADLSWKLACCFQVPREHL